MIVNTRVMRKADLVFGTILAGVAAYFLRESLLMPWEGLGGTMQGGLVTSPGALPAVISAAILFLSASLVGSAWRGGARITREDLEKAVCVLRSPESKRIIIMMLIIIGYVFGLIGRLPFDWATFIYLAVFMLVFKAAKWPYVLLISAASAWIISFCFGTLVEIPLP